MATGTPLVPGGSCAPSVFSGVLSGNLVIGSHMLVTTARPTMMRTVNIRPSCRRLPN
ncbi:MAG TPA: hypothetical protein PK440_12045 [Candidatus Accumulibacter phosphatis]|nr:hypothetical protein [Candidatus Accumulibacter phosphatis]HRQ95710.1 hypothetical protein [Candidatus Accumulibacter phosphatis]